MYIYIIIELKGTRGVLLFALSMKCHCESASRLTFIIFLLIQVAFDKHVDFCFFVSVRVFIIVQGKQGPFVNQC
jgi:hypothetical protein